MSVLVGILAHDRPELLTQCLASLRPASARFYGHLDAAEPSVCSVALDAPGVAWLISSERKGVGGSLNYLLKQRKPGEHFCQVDSDTVIATEGWLEKLTEGLAHYGCVAPVAPNTVFEERWKVVETPATGIRLFHESILDELGAFRTHGLYWGGEDNDYFMRMKALGVECAYDSAVVAQTAAPSGRRGERREWQEQAIRALKKWEPIYERRESLHEPLR